MTSNVWVINAKRVLERSALVNFEFIGHEGHNQNERNTPKLNSHFSLEVIGPKSSGMRYVIRLYEF